MDLSSTSIKKETKTKKERERDKTPKAGGPPWDRVRLRSPGPTRQGPCLPGCGPWEERPPAHPAPSPASPQPQLGRMPSQASSAFRGPACSGFACRRLARSRHAQGAGRHALQALGDQQWLWPFLALGAPSPSSAPDLRAP